MSNNIIEEILKLEGGYVNDADDKGKETYKGVSRKHHPKWKGWDIVDIYASMITKAGMIPAGDNINEVLEGNDELQVLVQEFYEDEYLKPFEDIPNVSIKTELFDTAVNMGVSRSKEMLQVALNLLNKNEKLYDDLKVDAAIGPVTLAAYKKVRPEILLKVLNGLQFCRYKDNVEEDPTQEKFFAGWMKRV